MKEKAWAGRVSPPTPTLWVHRHSCHPPSLSTQPRPLSGPLLQPKLHVLQTGMFKPVVFHKVQVKEAIQSSFGNSTPPRPRQKNFLADAIL